MTDKLRNNELNEELLASVAGGKGFRDFTIEECERLRQAISDVAGRNLVPTRTFYIIVRMLDDDLVTPDEVSKALEECTITMSSAPIDELLKRKGH